MIGVDVGGTFTDVVGLTSDGRVLLAKAASTPLDQSEGVLAGLVELAGMIGISLPAMLAETTRIVHGTTVATNALLERRGAEVAMLTTEGHRDVVDMREGLKPDRYDLRLAPPVPLVAREKRIHVRERLRADGAVAIPLDAVSLQEAISAARGAQSVAICFLHAWRDPRHEQAAAAAVRAMMPQAFVTTSSEVLPEIKEFERFSTTLVNAYVGPLVGRYLHRLASSLQSAGYAGELFVILSHGGLAPVGEAVRLAAATALSGPAGGVAAAVALAQDGLGADLLTLDMGGTSTDIALVQGGEALLGRGRSVDGHRIALESLDILTLGAGGGSIARIGPGGVLQVGPTSAGAVPGPVAYGTGGTEPTVTDANLLLGALDPKRFLGGRRHLDLDASRAALHRLGEQLGLSAEATAAGIIRLANVRMADGVRVATVRRGIDPRGFCLLAFGGAAGLHATAVAREIGIRRVLVPLFAAGLSAWGMLHTEPRYEISRSVLDEATLQDEAALRVVFDGLEQAARQRMEGWGLAVAKIRRRADMRYGEQVFEVDVPLDGIEWNAPGLPQRLIAAFHARHRALFTYDIPAEEVVLVNARLAATSSLAASAAAPRPAAAAGPTGERRVTFNGTARNVPVFDFAALGAGSDISGPAVVESDTTTVLLLPGDDAVMDRRGVLHIDL
jgi:N-methylhydantoinase A